MLRESGQQVLPALRAVDETLQLRVIEANQDRAGDPSGVMTGAWSGDELQQSLQSMGRRSVEQASLAVRLSGDPQVEEVSDDGVPNLRPGGQEYHDVTWRDRCLGVDLMPLPARRADSHRGGFDQAPDTQGDE